MAGAGGYMLISKVCLCTVSYDKISKLAVKRYIYLHYKAHQNLCTLTS
jgi:hypothetical protein